MIKKIVLNIGPAVGQPHLEFEPGHITIFVGPNNSGKSLLLREIEKYCENGAKAGQMILNDITFDFPDDLAITKTIEDLSVINVQNADLNRGQIQFGKINSTKGMISQAVAIPDLLGYKIHSLPTFIYFYVRMFTSRLGGKERFNLVNDTSHQDLQTPPQTNLMALFKDDEKRKKVRSIIYEAFRKYFVIDPTGMQQLRIKLSDVEPPNDDVERGWGKESVNFHSKATHIKHMSDGVQAFTGLVLAALVGDEKYLMIDEPEAFLHPSLSNLLGKKIPEIIFERGGNLFVSTHSSNFIMGCIQSGKEVNIVRLTYSINNVGTARILSSEKVSKLFKNPLLRSVGVLQSLFYNFVIVTEGDADRAFYNEINERLLSFNDARGIKNCLIINAQGKHTVWDIVKPLREFGIPAVGLVDIDFVKDGGTDCSKALDSCGVPEALKPTYQNLRGTIKKLFEDTGRDMKKDGGIEILTGANKETAKKWINDLKEYGLFVVPTGEVESWLKYLNVPGHGPKWLIPMFEKLKDDSMDVDYIKPGTGDVWEFLGEINSWLNDDNKKGIPN